MAIEKRWMVMLTAAMIWLGPRTPLQAAERATTDLPRKLMAD